MFVAPDDEERPDLLPSLPAELGSWELDWCSRTQSWFARDVATGKIRWQSTWDAESSRPVWCLATREELLAELQCRGLLPSTAATRACIRRYYRQYLLGNHPDKGGAILDDAVSLFQALLDLCVQPGEVDAALDVSVALPVLSILPPMLLPIEDGCDFVCDVVSSGVGSVLDLAVPGVEGHVRDDSLVVGVDDATSVAGLPAAWCGWCVAADAAERGELRTLDGRGVCLACSLDSLHDSKRTGRPRWRFVDAGHFGTGVHRGGLRWVQEQIGVGAAVPDLAPLGGEEHFLCVASSCFHSVSPGSPVATECCASESGCGDVGAGVVEEVRPGAVDKVALWRPPWHVPMGPGDVTSVEAALCMAGGCFAETR